MDAKKITAEVYRELIARLLVLFLAPWVVMKGWDAIAWEFNLPQFDYWACFFITHGFCYLTKNIGK